MHMRMVEAWTRTAAIMIGSVAAIIAIGETRRGEEAVSEPLAIERELKSRCRVVGDEGNGYQEFSDFPLLDTQLP